MQQATIINLSYLIASVLFIFGLKGLTHPRTAVKGNLTAAIAMLIAVVVTLLDQNIVGFGVIIAGIIIGGAIGMLLAIKIKMTDIPQLVALFNGFGGGASVFVAGAALIEVSVKTKNPELHLTVATVVSGLVGAVTFWGSLIAFGKLQGLKFANDVRFSGQQLVNALCALSAVGAALLVIYNPSSVIFYWLLVIVGSALGVPGGARWGSFCFLFVETDRFKAIRSDMFSDSEKGVKMELPKGGWTCNLITPVHVS